MKYKGKTIWQFDYKYKTKQSSILWQAQFIGTIDQFNQEIKNNNIIVEHKKTHWILKEINRKELKNLKPGDYYIIKDELSEDVP